ncbi:MAG TPA: NAD(P)-dependent oxidoreductase [Steroidobacteraceae bacterium]|nr:NAD(P)-dependent oxidoreductase [Steroidobacteraceae bacterium]
MEVGFIGLGRMGSAIAANLVRAGHTVRVWNRSAEAGRELERLGAKLAGAPAETARAEVLFSMLADDDATRSVLLGGGVLDAASRGLIHANLATVSVAFARELAQLEGARGIDYVAAPVFGRPEAAQAAKLNVVTAGDAAAIARLKPLFAAFAERVWPISGAAERANVVKLAGNFMIASALETMGEAAALVQAHGIGAGEFLEVLTSTLFAAPVYQNYGRLIAAKRYEPAGFKLALGLKDVRLVLEAGGDVHVPLPFASVLRDHFLEALAAGRADQDWAALAAIAAAHGPPQPRDP